MPENRNIFISVVTKGANQVKQLATDFIKLGVQVLASAVAFQSLVRFMKSCVDAAIQENKQIRLMNSALTETERASGAAGKALDYLEEKMPLESSENLAKSFTKLKKAFGESTDETTRMTEKVAAFAAVAGTDSVAVTELLTNTFEAFGDSAGTVDSQLGKIYGISQRNKIGFEELNAIMNRSGDDAKRMGLSYDQYLGMIDKMTASGMNMREIYTAIKGAADDGAAGLARLAPYMGEVTDESEKLNKAWKEVGESGRYQFQRLGAIFENFKEDIGRGILEAFSGFAKGMNLGRIKSDLNEISAYIEKMKPTIAEIGEIVGSEIGNTLDNLTAVIGLFDTKTTKINTTLKDVWNTINNIFNVLNPILWVATLIRAGIESWQAGILRVNALFNGEIGFYEFLKQTLDYAVKKWEEIFGIVLKFKGLFSFLNKGQKGGAAGAGIDLFGGGETGGTMGPFAPTTTPGITGGESEKLDKVLKDEEEKRKEMDYRLVLAKFDAEDKLWKEYQDKKDKAKTDAEDLIKADKLAAKERAKSYGDILAEGLLSGKMLAAVKSIFGDYLSSLLSSVFSNTVGSLLDQMFSGVTNLFKGIPGIGFLFGDKGWIQGGGKIQKFAQGDLFGPGISRFNKPTLGMVAEAGVGEITAAMPENARGVMIASMALQHLMNKTGITPAGSSSQTVVNITERASQYVDVATAEATARGNRLLGNDLTQ